MLGVVGCGGGGGGGGRAMEKFGFGSQMLYNASIRTDLYPPFETTPLSKAKCYQRKNCNCQLIEYHCLGRGWYTRLSESLVFRSLSSGA